MTEEQGPLHYVVTQYSADGINVQISFTNLALANDLLTFLCTEDPHQFAEIKELHSYDRPLDFVHVHQAIRVITPDGKVGSGADMFNPITPELFFENHPRYNDAMGWTEPQIYHGQIGEMRTVNAVYREKHSAEHAAEVCAQEIARAVRAKLIPADPDGFPPIDTDKLIRYMSTMVEQERSGQTTTVAVGPHRALSMIGALQLALRNSQMGTGVRSQVVEGIKALAAPFEGTFGSEIIARGWSPDQDLTQDEYTDLVDQG